MPEAPPPPPSGPTPIPVIATNPPSLISQGAKSKNAALRVVGGIALGMVLSTALLAGGAYWMLTAPERLERKATESLGSRAGVEAILLQTPNPPKAVELTMGSWARQIVKVVETDWQIQPSESRAYPYTGTIRISTHRWATVHHLTREEAEADDAFYATRDAMFYESPEGYSRSGPIPLVHTVELAYDRHKGWQTRKRSPP